MLKTAFKWLIALGAILSALLALFLLPIAIFARFKLLSDPPNNVSLMSPGGGLRSDCQGIPKEYIPFVNGAAKMYNVSAALLAAMMTQESSGSAGAVSKAGAQGLMQVMPETFNEIKNSTVNAGTATEPKKIKFGKNVNGKNLKGDAFDPETSIYAGAHYLTGLLHDPRTKGNERFAIAAYNAGPGAVDSFQGIPRGGEYDETWNYVKSIHPLPEDDPDKSGGLYGRYKKCLDQNGNLQNATTNANAERIRRAVASGGWKGQQYAGECFINVTSNLSKTFNWSRGSAYGLRQPGVPSKSDLDQLRKTLASNQVNGGNLPMWHIEYIDGSSEHWIVVLSVDENNNIEFYDPNGGFIDTKPYNAKTPSGDAFFGGNINGYRSDIGFRGMEAVISGVKNGK
ncbi:lytic transglycosylase domain-containing protein [Candidatus Berkelbacteria bacterium]|nr:lytic transglycosylase domain-containing protein [Candidatus Berkelbacteria bacterium]